jgi:hypothetical protein
MVGLGQYPYGDLKEVQAFLKNVLVRDTAIAEVGSAPAGQRGEVLMDLVREALEEIAVTVLSADG